MGGAEKRSKARIAFIVTGPACVDRASELKSFNLHNCKVTTMKKRNYWHVFGIAGLMTAAISVAIWARRDREQREHQVHHSLGG